jgi:putative ABC transport system ATP-binding protein
MENVINLVNISKNFNKIPVLKDINLSIKKGELVIIVGDCGSGKTTLLNIISGLDRPSSGKVLLFGKRVDDLSDDKFAEIRKEYLGFIPQQDIFIEELSVWENILLGVMIKYNSDRSKLKQAKDIALHYLEKLNLVPEECSLSGRKLINILTVLLKEPEVLIADEPFGSFDNHMKNIILESLLSYNKDLKKTLIITTVDKNLSKNLPKMCNNKIFYLMNGKLFPEKEVVK